MRAPILVLALLAAGASRGGCDGATPYEPCAAKACGDACRTCAPDDASCVEPALPPSLATVCDPRGACTPVDVMAAGGNGPAAAGCAAAACAGKPCGEACTIDPPCRAATPPCMVPSRLGHCDGTGACVAVDPPPPGFCLPPPPPHPDCVGKACGDACNPCGPERTCPTLIPSACDRFGSCVGEVPWLCYDPCGGKACGAACTACPPDAADCAETMVVKACDATGRCVPAPAACD